MFLCGCGGGSGPGGGRGNPPPSPTITSITVSCSPSSVLITQTSVCAATVSGTGSFSNTVTWSVAPSSRGSISSTGVFTPAVAGTVTVTATSTQDSTKSGNGTISASNTTALAVSITDLPSGAAGAVTITDPNGLQSTLTSSQIVTAIPGTYTVVAATVTSGSSAYIAKLPTQSVTVTAGELSPVDVDYYTVIPQTTKVLDSAGMQGLTISTDGTTITISVASAIATSLSAGDVLVVPPIPGVAPMGLLRKVVSIASGASTMIVTVQSATLADAFQRLSLQLNTQATPSTTQSVRTAPGVVFRPHAAIHGRHGGATAMIGRSAVQDPCGGSSLGVFDITEPISLDPVAGISLDGQVELCSAINLQIDLEGKGFSLPPQLNAFTATATVGESADLTLHGEFLNGSFNPDPVKLATLPGEPIPVPGLPFVWVTPEISVFVGASGNISTGLSTEFAEAGAITGGVSYSSGQWTPIKPTPTMQTSYSPPAIDASMQAKAYAGLEMDLNVWDLLGPSFKPDEYLEFNADITTNPWWTLTGGVEGPMSLDVTFLGETLASYDLGDMFDWSTMIASAPGPFSPSAAAPIIQSLSPSQTTAGGASFILAIAGTNFVPGAVVNFGPSALNTTYETTGALNATVPPSLISQAGTVSVTVANPGTGAGISSPATFTINPATGKVIISPASVSVPAGEVQTFSATVSGTGTVNWSVQEGSAGGTISSAGIYTAPQNTGTYHVIAASSTNSTETATATVNVVAGPEIATIHSFDHTKEGAVPSAPLILTSSGIMYGTTEAGGNLSCAYISTLKGCGTIFQTDTSGNVTTLHSFAGIDGAYPVASLLAATNGTLYGTTLYGGSYYSSCDLGGTSTPAGCGTLFTYSTAGIFASIYSFGPYTSSIGVGPKAPLFQSSNGTLYGTADVGGSTACAGSTGTVSRTGFGAVFDLTGTSAPASLHTFTGSEGAYPAAALFAVNGNFYSTTEGGGALSCSSYTSPGCGTVFGMTPVGAISLLHSFTGSDGSAPDSPLMLGADGNIYGSTFFGGSATCAENAQYQGCGTIFKTDTSGNFTLLHSFSGADGAYPGQLYQASDGYFYGTAYGGGDIACTGKYGPGCGVIFRMDTSGNVTVLYVFTGASDGSWPAAGLIAGPDGNLYGTTAYGGSNDDGVIFRISGLSSLTVGSQPAIAAPEKQVIVPVSAHNIHETIPRPTMPPN